MEISPLEDYWPNITKALIQPKVSFHTFGWKHFNIYNISSALLLLLGSLYYFKTATVQKVEDSGSPVVNETPISNSRDSVSGKNLMEEHSATTQKASVNKKRTASEPSATTQSKDSVANQTKEEPLKPIVEPEPIKTITEEKPKPKRIIYVVQQDTIIKKDTVKVRRKRKK